MMPRSARPLPLFFACFGSAALVALACSSNASDDDSSPGAGGSSANSGGTTGGSGANASGGSANATSTGGSSANGGGTTATGGSGATTATGGAGGTTGGGTANGGSANSTSSGGSGAYPTSACEGLPFDTAGEGGESSMSCTGVSNEAEAVPIDLFIMMDRSISMANLVPGTNMTRWDALVEAVREFTQSDAGDDIRAGLGFFGASGENDTEIDCAVGNYSTPAVAIGTLADVGDDIVTAMTNMVPGGLTPAGPALEGALAYASSWAANNPGRATAVVLVTDGYPTQCEPQAISDLAALAEQAHVNKPYVRTYTIGLGGDVNLDAIAESGGTHAAFKVDEGDISSSFVTALHNVADTALACEYALPPPPSGNQKLDLSKVQVTYTPAGDAPTEEIPAIPSIASCSGATNGGWYYDNPDAPTSIEVCPCTCARFDAGKVDVRVGCKPRIGPR